MICSKAVSNLARADPSAERAAATDKAEVKTCTAVMYDAD
jgi:hypothetical protein